MENEPSSPLVGSVRFTKSTNRRRKRAPVRRTQRVTAWYSAEEYARMVAFAAAARMAPAAYVAEASLRPSAWKVGAGADRVDEHQVSAGDTAPRGGLPPGAVLEDPPGPVEHRQMLLLELMGIHRQLRGAATNLNQAVAKLHSLGVPVDELPAIAAYVRTVAVAVDDATTAVARSRSRR